MHFTFLLSALHFSVSAYPVLLPCIAILVKLLACCGSGQFPGKCIYVIMTNFPVYRNLKYLIVPEEATLSPYPTHKEKRKDVIFSTY